MKIFASDFDGTLRRYDREKPYILESDLDAIASFRAAGNLFGMCSGRAFDSILKEQKPIPYTDFYIVTTGAVIGRVNGERKEFLYEKEIRRSCAEEIYEKYHDNEVFYVHMDGDLYRIGKLKGGESAQRFLEDFSKLPEGKIEGVSIGAGTRENAYSIATEINEAYAESLNAFQNNDYLDVVAKGCSKGEGINQLRSMYPDTCIAGIGDSYNDIPLLDAADVAFTFDFAPETVQKHADYVVHDVKEAIEIFMKL